MGGLLLVALLIGGVVMFGGGSGGGGGGGGKKNCGRVILSADMVTSKMDIIVAVAQSFKPNDSGIEDTAKLMRIIYPSCAWTTDTTATLVGPTGKEIEWSDVVAAAGNKTMAELNADPEFQGLISPGGPEGISPTSTSAQAAANFMGISLP